MYFNFLNSIIHSFLLLLERRFSVDFFQFYKVSDKVNFEISNVNSTNHITEFIYSSGGY
jgi:hypothetical protein